MLKLHDVGYYDIQNIKVTPQYSVKAPCGTNILNVFTLRFRIEIKATEEISSVMGFVASV